MGGYWNIGTVIKAVGNDQAACWMGGYWNYKVNAAATFGDQAAC